MLGEAPLFQTRILINDALKTIPRGIMLVKVSIASWVKSTLELRPVFEMSNVELTMQINTIVNRISARANAVVPPLRCITKGNLRH